MQDVQSAIHRNKRCYLLSSALYTFAVNFMSAGFLQTYFVRLGLNTVDISLYGTCTMLAGMLGYFAFTLRRPAKMLRVMYICGLLMCLHPLVLMICEEIDNKVLILPILCLSIMVMEFCASIRISGEYSVSPLLFPRHDYGRILAKCGMLSSLMAMVVSNLGLVLNRVSMEHRYMMYFGLAAVALLFSALLIRGYHTVDSLEPVAEKQKKSWKKHPSKQVGLLFPHLLRSVGEVGFYYFVAVSMKKVDLSITGQSLFVAVGSTALLMACYVFMQIEKHFKTGVITLVAHIVCTVMAVLTCINTSEIGFLVLYALYNFSATIQAYAIPTGVLYSTSIEDLPFLSSMRLLVGKIASFILLTPVALLLESVPAWTVMAGMGGVYILAGCIFYKQFGDRIKAYSHS